MRWFWVLVSVIGVALAVMAKTPGYLAIGILLAFVGITATIFALAAARIEERSRPDSMMLSLEELGEIRRQSAAQKPARPAAPTAPAPPTPIRRLPRQ